MRAHRILVAAALVLLIGGFAAHAASPTQVTFTDNNLFVPFYSYGDPGGCTVSCLKYSSALAGGASNGGFANSKWANYTNIAFGSPTNPSQSFAVGVSHAIGTLQALSSDHVEVQLTFSSSAAVLRFWSETPVLSVNYLQGSSYQAVVQQASYGTSLPFTCATAPCVYENAANSTYAVFLAVASPVTVDFYYATYGGGVTCGIAGTQACGSGSGSGSSGGSTSTTSSSTSASSPGPGGNVFTETTTVTTQGPFKQILNATQAAAGALLGSGTIDTKTFDMALLGTLVILAVAGVIGARSSIKKGAKRTLRDGLRELNEPFSLDFDKKED